MALWDYAPVNSREGGSSNLGEDLYSFGWEKEEQSVQSEDDNNDDDRDENWTRTRYIDSWSSKWDFI